MKFNPANRLNLAIVDLAGKLKLLNIDENENTINVVKNYNISQLERTEEAIYSFDYSSDGDTLLCGTNKGELILVSSGKVLKRFKNTHEGNITAVKFIDEKLFTSADSNGEIKIYDIRSKNEIFKFKEQTEDITDFEVYFKSYYLLSTSLDGTLAVYDIRKEGKYNLYALSDCIEDELYCLKIVKNGQKVACGTSEGPIVLFNWDWFGDYKDRILGHPTSINCIDKYDEDFIVTGSEDGDVRFVSITPKYIHSFISDKTKNKNINKNKSFIDISNISLNSDRKYLAVCSNINYIKLYNIRDINIVNVRDDIGDGSENSENEEIEDDMEEDNEDDDNEDDKFSEDDFDEEKEEICNNQNNLNEEMEEKEIDQIVSSNQDFDDEDSFDSSSFGNKKNKKQPQNIKLSKKDNSQFLIDKERRKDFFNNI
jgi:WD40 repeat protein